MKKDTELSVFNNNVCAPVEEASGGDISDASISSCNAPGVGGEVEKNEDKNSIEQIEAPSVDEFDEPII